MGRKDPPHQSTKHSHIFPSQFPDMKTKCIFLSLMVALTMLLTSCHDDPAPKTHVAGQTVVVMMPWSFNLDTFFHQNIKEMEEAIVSGTMADERVLVCFANTTLKATLFELKAEQGRCVRDTIKVYEDINFTAASNITKLLAEVEKTAPAHHYAMIIAGHGMAWLPAGVSPNMRKPRRQKGDLPLTRWIGGITRGTQIEISKIAEGIQLSGLHMDYILFDDCFMSSVEVAYELRDVADYIIGSSSEIMAYGFPYKQCFRYLLGSPNFQRLCETFHEFYSYYEVPCGTVAVTDCRELESLADIAKRINSAFPSTNQYNDVIQKMDGFAPPLFYDLGDTYARLCADNSLLAAFNRQMEKTVPYKACTPSYFTVDGGYGKIEHFSGLNTSQTSDNTSAATWGNTKWAQAVMK